jgi:hypothetical protein
MPELDPEVLGRVLRWCALSGGHPSEDAVRSALEPLSWDEMLAVRAALADPPPRRGLGPAELVALAKRPPRDLRDDSAPAAASRAAAGEPVPARKRGRRAAVSQRAVAPRIRRVRDRAAATLAAPPPLPFLQDLYREEGRAVLERLLRRFGPSRPGLAAALSAGWRRSDGGPAQSEDLEPLLAHHGLARPFAERERAMLLHTLRKLGGVRTRAARETGLSLEELDSAVDRLGLGPAVESLREERRRKLLRRGTLAERARLFAAEEEALSDLGIASEVEADLRRLLAEHLRALRASGKRSPLAAALADSLFLPRTTVDRMVEKLGVNVAAPSGRSGPPLRKPGAPTGPPRERRGPPRAAGSPSRPRGAPGASPRPRAAPFAPPTRPRRRSGRPL